MNLLSLCNKNIKGHMKCRRFKAIPAAFQLVSVTFRTQWSNLTVVPWPTFYMIRSMPKRDLNSELNFFGFYSGAVILCLIA